MILISLRCMNALLKFCFNPSTLGSVNWAYGWPFIESSVIIWRALVTSGDTPCPAVIKFMQIEWLNSYLSTRFSALFHGLDKLIIKLLCRSALHCEQTTHNYLIVWASYTTFHWLTSHRSWAVLLADDCEIDIAGNTGNHCVRLFCSWGKPQPQNIVDSNIRILILALNNTD